MTNQFTKSTAIFAGLLLSMTANSFAVNQEQRSQITSWTESFLWHQITVAEYESLRIGARNSTYLAKKISNQQLAQRLILRAAYARNMAAALGQKLLLSQDLQAKITSFESESDTRPLWQRRPYLGVWTISEQEYTKFNALIFADSEISLASYTTTSLNECTYPTMIAHFGSVNNQAARIDGSTNYAPLIAFISKLNAEQLTCLVAGLMSSDQELVVRQRDPDPRGLLEVLVRTNLQKAPQSTFNNLLAICYLQDGVFPEVLRLLHPQVQLSAYYSFAYNQVQRLYHYRQNGLGRVSIKSI